MKVTRAYILLAIIILLTILFIVGQMLQYDAVSNAARSLILPFATTLYFIKVRDRSFYFSSFLILFSLSELMGLWIDVIPNIYMFYIGNSLYILAYILLIIEVLGYIKRSPDYKNFFIKYALHIAILTMFAIYLVVLLAEIERPHMDNFEYALSMVYNSVIMSLLTISLLNFICNDTKRAFILFLATMCIVFSEIVQVAYFYLSDTYTLGLVYSLLLVVAFYLFYRQGFLKQEANRNLNLFKS